MFYQSWCAWDKWCAHLVSLPQKKNLGMTIELDPQGDKITCPAFGLYSSPVECSTVGHIVLDLTSLAYQPKSRERSARPKKHVTFALSKQKSAYPAHARELDEDEDDKPLVQLASREEPVERESAAERRVPAQLRRRKGPPVWRDPSATLEQDVSGTSRERSEEVSTLGNNSDSEALQQISNQLSDLCNLNDLHLKTLLHVYRAVQEENDSLGHSWKGLWPLPACSEDVPILQIDEAETWQITRERIESRRIWRSPSFWIMDEHKIGDKTFGFLIVLDGATSHLTAYPCKSTSPSEVISKLHEWMGTFQMNPKAICADAAFHHPHDMQTFYRMHNVKRLPIGPHTPWPNRAEMGVRLFKEFLSAFVDTASKTLDQTTLPQITPAQLMRKAATVRNTQVTLSGKTPVELAIGWRRRDHMDPASMDPEQLTSTSNKQDLLNVWGGGRAWPGSQTPRHRCRSALAPRFWGEKRPISCQIPQTSQVNREEK